MKTLITGGAGFIGSAIVDKLYNMGGRDITVLNSMTDLAAVQGALDNVE